MYMAVWGVLPHSNSIFYRIFVNYTSDFRHFPKNRRFASGGGWRNGAFVHFAVEVCRFGRRLDLPPLYPAGDAPALPPVAPLPLACWPAPYPPSPLPRRGRGSPKVYFAGGFAPGTPALNRLRHLQNLPLLYPAGACPAGHPPDSAAAVPGGGLTFFVASLPRPQLAFLPPIPPAPFPGGEGGDQKFISPGAKPPAPLH